MSGKVQVLIDLGTIELSEDTELSPHGILKAIREIDSVKEANSKLAQENSMLKNDFKAMAGAIERVLDGDYSLIEKFRDLRQIARGARDFEK